MKRRGEPVHGKTADVTHDGKTLFAAGTEPVNDTLAMRGWAARSSPVEAPPWTTLNTPSGTPASRKISASSLTSVRSWPLEAATLMSIKSRST